MQKEQSAEHMEKVSQGEVRGILAEFSNPGELLHAAEEIRDAGYRDFDCHSPFPIHGMEQAMGQKRSPLGFIVGIMGLLGGGGALLLQWWTSAVDYRLVVAGKPFFDLPAFIPVTFELTILLAAFGAVFGMFALTRMPRFFHPVFFSDRFERVTDDGFFVSIESSDQKFDAESTGEFLESLGSDHVELLVDTRQQVQQSNQSEE